MVLSFIYWCLNPQNPVFSLQTLEKHYWKKVLGRFKYTCSKYGQARQIW